MANKPEDVLIIIVKDGCPACRNIKSNPNLYKNAVKNANIGVRVEIVNTPIDENIWPSGLIPFSNITPTFLLVRGDIWEAAKSKENLGKNNRITFESAVGLDIEIVGGRINRTRGQYLSINVNSENEVVNWVKSALKTLNDKSVSIKKTQPEPESKTVTCSAIRIGGRKLY